MLTWLYILFIYDSYSSSFYFRALVVPHQTGAVRVELDALLAASDYVVLVCPSTPETHHLIDEAALARMKPTACLINIVRVSVGGAVRRTHHHIARISITLCVPTEQFFSSRFNCCRPEDLW